MTVELNMLIWSVPLLVLYIMTQAFFMTKQAGSDYNAGPRDNEVVLTGNAGRAKRALANFLETYPAFIALALVVTIMNGSTYFSQWGATLYVVARLVYLPSYIVNIKYLRSLIWMLSLVGLLLMFIGVLI